MRIQALWVYAIYSNVLNVHSTPWTAEVPQTISGLKGSCVVVPCKFNYPGAERKHSDLRGMWHTEENQYINHPDPSKVTENFRGRTNLAGDLVRKDCSLRIDRLGKRDSGQIMFRIEIADFNKFSYKDSKVFIDVQDSPASPSLTVSGEFKAGKAVTASCSVSHSCPTDLPQLTWNHNGTSIVQSQQLINGQWRVTSNLTFTAKNSDHNKLLLCTAEYQQNETVRHKTILNIKYAPVSVVVETDSTVLKEGDALEMQCSSDSNPPAHSHQWYNITGALLSEERVFKLHSVSRHTGSFYCVAINTEGHKNSTPVKINVEYSPRIGVESACTAKMTGVRCWCLVESSPTSRVQWIIANDTVANSSTISITDGEDSRTLHTLYLSLGVTDTVSCSASNKHGGEKRSLQTNQRGPLMTIYLSGLAASVFVLILVILVLWKCSRQKKSLQGVETRKNPLYSPEGLKEGKDPVKGLCAPEDSDDIYVNNVKQHCKEEEEELDYENYFPESVYANM